MEIKKENGMIKKIDVAVLIFALLSLAQVIHYPLGVSLSEGKPFVFPEITGWKQTGEIQTFEPKALYEYINGAADLYLAYDFQELKVAEYGNVKKASVTVEVYRHNNPTNAFGMYSQERLSDANYLNIGTQGYLDKNMFNFIAGPYYVKINSFDTGSEDEEILRAFAGKVAENLGEKGALPPMLTSFPGEGKVKNSEKFIAKKFLGYAYFHSAFTAAYETSGKRFELFVIETTSPSECKDMIQKYFQQIGRPEKEVAEGRYTLSDPHHGEIDLSWKGRTIWGVLNLGDPSLRSKYLTLLEAGLKKSQ